MYDLLDEFKVEKDDLVKPISNLGLKYENTLLNPMIDEPYKCTGLLSNLRFFGPGITPGVIDATMAERSYANDTSKYPLIQFIILLFPSPAGTLNHFCTHPNHLTKLFVESNSTDKIENASNLLVCSITGEKFQYTSKGIEQDIKKLKEEKAKLEKSINKNKVQLEAINSKKKEKNVIQNSLSVLHKEKRALNKSESARSDRRLQDIEKEMKEGQDKLNKIKEEIVELKRKPLKVADSEKIEVENKKIKLKQKIMKKSKKAFEELGIVMKKALEKENFFNTRTLLPMIIHEFVKSAFTIGQLKAYMRQTLIKINEKIIDGKVKANDLKGVNINIDWANALVKIYLTNNTFPYSRFNLPVSNISIPSYIRGKDGKEGYFHEKTRYADCVEVAIMQLCNCLLFNPKYNSCDLSHLENAALTPEIKEFYEKHPDPYASITHEKRNDWSKVLEDRPDLIAPDNNIFQTNKIIYNNDNRNELDTGLINMMSVLVLIFGVDRELIFDEFNEENILERLEILLKELAAPGMNVKIENTDPNELDSSKVYFEINGNPYYRIEFFGRVDITFSHNVDQENLSITKMSIEHEKWHTSFEFRNANSVKIDLANEISLLSVYSPLKEFSIPSMINRVFFMAGNKPLPKGNALEDMYASGLVESNEKKLEMLAIVYEEMTKVLNDESPAGINDLQAFVGIIGSILESVPLDDPMVFYKFAPFLLHSEKYSENLNGINLRLVYESSNNNLLEHWAKYADKRLRSFGCSFNIDKKGYDNELSMAINFYKKFTKLTFAELYCDENVTLDQETTLSNSMEILTKLTNCTGLKLCFHSIMLKYFIDGAIAESEALQKLGKLIITLKRLYDFKCINDAFEKLPVLVKALENLSEIRIENIKLGKTRDEDFKAENLLALLKRFPLGRKITINLVGKLATLNEIAGFVRGLKGTPSNVKICLVYEFRIFTKDDARNLKVALKDSNLDITIFHIKNGIKRRIQLSIALLDNLLTLADNFYINFTSFMRIGSTNIDQFITSFDLFFKGLEWKHVSYEDLNRRTEMCKLQAVLNTLNAYEVITFEGNFLEINNKDEADELITRIVKRGKPLILSFTTLLIDSENFIPFYNEIVELDSLRFNFRIWLIRIRGVKIDRFRKELPLIYDVACSRRCGASELLNRVNALSELKVFTINLSNIFVVYICDDDYDTVLRVLKGIKSMFKKVYIAECEFTEEQVTELRAELEKDDGNTLEIDAKSRYY
ncbi:hypothetical protein GINT2_001255 [Glugoides intestinalis]